MKAWIVSVPDEFCSLFHAETRGKAKLAFKKCFDVEYIEIKAVRLSGLDDKLISFENAAAAGFYYTNPYADRDDSTLLPEEFINDCHCNICRGE